LFASYKKRTHFKQNILNLLSVSKEIWCFYPNSDFYLISNYGQVKNLLTGKTLKQQCTTQGYKQVSFKINGKRKTKLVHRLVLETFLRIPQYKYLEVNHINGNKNDNSLNNLEWMTREENLQHARDNNLFKKPIGIKNPNYTFDYDIVNKVKKLRENNLTYKEISSIVDLSVRQIDHILNRR